MIDRVAPAAILISAAFLRFWRLGDWSFWADEVFTVIDAREFPALFRINFVPYAVVKFFVRLMGESEFAARLGFAIAGVLSVFVLYLIATSMFDRRTGLISAVFLSFLPWHLFWSQNARSYSFVLLFAAIASGSFYLAWERDSVGMLLGSMLAGVLTVASHLLAGVLALSFLTYLLILAVLPRIRPVGFRRRNLIIFLSPFLLALVALAHPKVIRFISSGWGHNIWARSPVYILMTVVWGVSLPVAFLVGYRFVSLIVHQRMDRGELMVACWCVVPLLFFTLGSLFQNVAGYYLFFTVPAYLILGARTISDVMDSRARFLLVLAVIASMLSWDVLYFTRENGGRPMWREAFQLVGKEMEPSDTVITTLPPLCEYYLPGARVEKIDLNATAEMLRSRKQRAWLVLDESNMNIVDPHHEYRRMVGKVGRFIRRFHVHARAADRSISVFMIPGEHRQHDVRR